LTQVFSDLNTEDLIDKSSDVMRYLLKKNIQPLKRKNIKNNHIYDLIIDYKDLEEENDFDVDIEFLRKYSQIKLTIKKEDDHKIFMFDLNNTFFTLEYDGNIYYFEINYKFPPGIFRKTNSSNIYLTYDVDIHNYKEGFRFSYPMSKKTTIEYNIIIKDTNIVCFDKLGLYSEENNSFGNFYVTFRPTNSISEEKMDESLPTVYSLEIEQLIN